MAQPRLMTIFSEDTVIQIDINDFDASIETIKNTMNKNSINEKSLNKNRINVINNYNFSTFCEKLINDIEKEFTINKDSISLIQSSIASLPNW